MGLKKTIKKSNDLAWAFARQLGHVFPADHQFHTDTIGPGRTAWLLAETAYLNMSDIDLADVLDESEGK